MIKKEFEINNNVYIVKDTDSLLYGLFDKNNNSITQIKYNRYNILSDREICFFEDQKCGVLDLNGNVIIPFLYDYITKSEKFNMFFVRLNYKYGIIDIENNKKSDIIYDDIYILKNGEIIGVKKDGKHGLLNRELELVLPIVFDDIIQTYLNVFSLFINKIEVVKIIFSEKENKIFISRKNKIKLIKSIMSNYLLR